MSIVVYCFLFGIVFDHFTITIACEKILSPLHNCLVGSKAVMACGKILNITHKTENRYKA